MEGGRRIASAPPSRIDSPDFFLENFFLDRVDIALGPSANQSRPAAWQVFRSFVFPTIPIRSPGAFAPLSGGSRLSIGPPSRDTWPSACGKVVANALREVRHRQCCKREVLQSVRDAAQPGVSEVRSSERA